MSTTINKNLGHVTAYAYAKAGGYTGTEAQFQALLGNIAIDLAEIENLTVVVNTLPAGSSATSSYSDGVLTLGIPRGDTGEVSDADLAEALEDYVEKTTLDDYAQVDGYYSDMTVGDAEQLISSMYVEDSEPYGYRTTGGSADVGNREYVDAIVGGTVAWNQHLQSYTYNGASVSVDGDVVTITPSSSSNRYIGKENNDDVRVIQNHVYLQSVVIKSDGEHFTGFQNYQYLACAKKTASATWTVLTQMAKASGSGKAVIQIYSNNDTEYQIKKGSFNLFDLTQMFGSTIADYIYSLEQATEGAGVAWFKKLFPKDYYEYNAGELISVSGLQSHDTVGFNQWDEEWEVGGISSSDGTDLTPTSATNRIRSVGYNPCIPSTVYYCRSSKTDGGNDNRYYIYAYFYDIEKAYISATPINNIAFTTPANARYFRISTNPSGVVYGNVYLNDICINLSWSGWRNGEYEPYQKHSYPLDDSLTLRGIPKLDSQNNLYYDGDEYKSDGSVTRRYGVVNLGTLTWNYLASDSMFFTTITGIYRNNKNLVCSKYPLVSLGAATMADKSMSVASGASETLWIKDSSYNDATTFKTAMSGVYLVYELATPTTETAESYQQIQICDDFGTEEFVNTSIVPVGHNTRYPANLRDKLQHLPNLADNDGAYLIRQVNKQMSLEVFRIPKAPTTDGTYVLKATVSGGTPTYTWEVEE